MNRLAAGYTLIEIVLAMALSVVLLGLLTLSVDQFLVNVQSSRQTVEHAQVARGVLQMIAADLRNMATRYEQDIATVSALADAAAAGDFDSDSIDEEDTSPPPTTTDTQDEPPPMGISGDTATLQIDVLHIHRSPIDQPEEFAALSATASELPFEGPPTTSGISTVRYSVDPGGGLVRQEIARDVALREEELGSTASWDATYRVVAEEVTAIQFHYSDGVNALDSWDLQQREGENPLAVEVVVTLREPRTTLSQETAVTESTRAYRMTVGMPAVDGGDTTTSDESTTSYDDEALGSSTQ